MRTPTLLLVTALATGMLIGPAAAHGPSDHDGPPHGQAHDRSAPGLGAELAEVRAATARYHDVTVAREDDYQAAGPCVEGPAGAMGHHYVNEALIGGDLEPTQPQVLLYIPGPDGQLRLVGVEYLHPDGGEVLGRPLSQDSPLGTETALHVWLWQANPAGMFAAYNPNLTC